MGSKEIVIEVRVPSGEPWPEENRTEVFLAGRSVGSFTIKRGQERRAVFPINPAALGLQPGRMNLRLESERFVNLSEVSESGDVRNLALRLIRLQIR